MTDAPERIWVEDNSTEWLDYSGVWGVDKENTHDVEYIRADLVDYVAMWLLASLNCDVFIWDADQREMAQSAIADVTKSNPPS